VRFLLDTHILIWLMADSSRLNEQARSLIANAAEVYVSPVSIWEIAIKNRLGKIEEDAGLIVAKLEAAGLIELDVTYRHALATSKLPLLHGDPFDRLLVAQAITEPMRFLTSDKLLCAYSELVIHA
jgi:PIN domain nuclease of toxin-antitoxin system